MACKSPKRDVRPKYQPLRVCDMVKAAALQKAATFDEFNEDNDPHGEHDFGSFEPVRSQVHFRKLEYYEAREGVRRIEDPSDPDAASSPRRLYGRERRS